MSFSDAEHLFRLCGPSKFLLIGRESAALAPELALRGGRCIAFDPMELTTPAPSCIVVDARWMDDQTSLESGFGMLQRAGSRWLVIRFTSASARARTGWERAALASGFRRAPQTVSIERYHAVRNPFPMLELLEFERIPDAACTYPTSTGALNPRTIYADMLRECGPRSDAHTVRYALAASLVRPGDTVLDCACRLGYGTAILAAQSAGGKYIGVDPDVGAVGYARANFSAQYGVDYRVADLADLASIEDSSVDLVVSFDTISCFTDYVSFVSEAKRVLKPDGRIVASVANLWASDNVNDTAPSHAETFDYLRFRALIGEHFIVEDRWAQTAPGGSKLQDAPRSLMRVPLEAYGQDTEWLILVGSIDPLRKVSSKRYQHPQFGCNGVAAAGLVDFGRYFSNPWLYRSMVQLGERIRDRDALNDLAARVLDACPPESADFGAALTVIGYALLADPESPFVDDVCALVAEYRMVCADNPHVRRWQISAAYVAARLLLMRGQRQAACSLLEWVTQADFLAFSPLLATKLIAAHFHLATMALADGDIPGAAARFHAGVATCRKALAADDAGAIGSVAAPLPFGFSELAEVADMGAQCAMAIELLPLYARSPGLFWQKVDTRRFGVVSWAQALERENMDLRMQLEAK
jgi:SAM-dependent methyltransferase